MYSPEGITADLKAMKQIGLGGAQIFTVDQSAGKGPVAFLCPKWRKLVHQTMTESADLHLELAMEGCDGWSESGGHWVTPAQSMQKVVWLVDLRVSKEARASYHYLLAQHCGGNENIRLSPHRPNLAILVKNSHSVNPLIPSKSR